MEVGSALGWAMAGRLGKANSASKLQNYEHIHSLHIDRVVPALRVNCSGSGGDHVGQFQCADCGCL